MGLASERNGVPVSAILLRAGSKASRVASPHDSASPAWWISSKITSVRRFSVRCLCSAGWAATCAYVTATPVKSAPALRIGVPRVDRDAEPARRLRPLVLEVLGRRDDRDRRHLPLGKQLGGDR